MSAQAKPPQGLDECSIAEVGGGENEFANVGLAQVVG